MRRIGLKVHLRDGRRGLGGSPAPRARRSSYPESLGIGALSFGTLLVIGLVSAIATSRIYGINVIGQFALVTAPTNVVWYLSSVREQSALIRELAVLPPRAPRVAGLFVAILTFSSGLTLVVAALVMVGTYFLFTGPIAHPELLAPAVVNMFGYVFITNLAWNYDSLLSAFRAAPQLFWIRLLQMLVFLGVAVVVGLHSGTVWGLVIATIACSLTGLVHRAVSSRAFMRWDVSGDEIRSGFDSLPDLLRFGIKATPGTIADGVSNEAGVWILGAVGSIAAVGAYSRAWTLGRRFVEMTFRITEMLYPTLVERWTKGDLQGFDRALVDSIRYSTVGLLLPAAAGGGAAAGVMAMFGPGFSRGAGALTLLLLMPAMFTVTSIQRHVLYAVDRPLPTTYGATGRMVLTLALGAVLTPSFGETGMAAAIVLGLLADLAYMTRTAHRHLSQPFHRLWPYSQMLAVLLAYACGYAAAHVTFVRLPGVAGVLVGLASGAAAFAVAFVLAGGINARDRDRVASIVARLRAGRSRWPTPQTQP